MSHRPGVVKRSHVLLCAGILTLSLAVSLQSSCTVFGAAPSKETRADLESAGSIVPRKVSRARQAIALISSWLIVFIDRFLTVAG